MNSMWEIKNCVLYVIVRVTHLKSVSSFSSVTGLKVRTFLYRPTTQAVSGVFTNTRPADTHTHTQVQASQHCLICCCSITGNWIWITDVSLRFKPLTLSKIVGHLLCQPLHGSNAQFSAIVSVKGCWHSTLLISEKRHQKTFKFFKNSNAASLFISE